MILAAEILDGGFMWFIIFGIMFICVVFGAIFMEVWDWIDNQIEIGKRMYRSMNCKCAKCEERRKNQ